jgi:hypothetical protein
MNRDTKGCSRQKMAAWRKAAAGTRVSDACKQIARYICQHGLGVGDALPPQRDLRRTFGFSNCSLSPAMQLLVDMGLITRSNGHGTVIRDLEPLNRLTWTVGVATIDEPIRGPGAAIAWILHAMQRQIARRHSTCHVYFRDVKPRWPHRLAEFPGLSEDVEAGAIDGLIVPPEMDVAAIACAGIPAVETGFMTSAIPFAILLDYPAMIAEAVARLLDGKVRRIALVGGDLRGATLERTLREAAGADGADGVATEVLAAHPGLASGADIVGSLLQRPAARRPDALIFADDFAAAGAAQTLAAQPDYRPRLAAMANKQLPQSWALPVGRFEFDLDEIAERAVGMLGEAMLNPDLPPRQEKVQARLAESSEQW